MSKVLIYIARFISRIFLALSIFIELQSNRYEMKANKKGEEQ